MQGSIPRQTQRQTKSNDAFMASCKMMHGLGIFIGVVDEAEVPTCETVKYLGQKTSQRFF